MIRFIALTVLSACLSTIAVSQETTIRFGTPAIVPVDAFSSSITMGQSLMVLKHGKKTYSIDQYSLADLALQKSTPLTGNVKRKNTETAIASSPLKILKLNNEAYYRLCRFARQQAITPLISKAKTICFFAWHQSKNTITIQAPEGK